MKTIFSTQKRVIEERSRFAVLLRTDGGIEYERLWGNGRTDGLTMLRQYRKVLYVVTVKSNERGGDERNQAG